MDKQSKVILSILVACIVVLFTYIAFHPSQTILLSGQGSPTGTTNTSARIASIVVSTSASTSVAALLNSDGSDRIVTDVSYYFATGGATVTLTLATSTDPGSLLGNTNYLLNLSVASTTASTWPFLSSSTPATTGVTPANRLWPAGTYLDLQSSATTTEQGVFVIKYISS